MAEFDFDDLNYEERMLQLLDSDFDDSDADDEMMLYLANQYEIPEIIQPRVNLFELWTDDNFLMKFRLTRPTVHQLMLKIQNELKTQTNRNSVTPINQLMLTLRFYATGCMLTAGKDFPGIHERNASVIVGRVSRAIAQLCSECVKFPSTPAELRNVQEGFYAESCFPRVIGAIGCIHVKVQSPGVETEEAFRNHKNYFSMKVQTISDPWLRIINVVARWPGSCHDETIFRKSKIRAQLEKGEFGDCLIVGDSNYTLNSYMITPISNPILEEEALFNEAQVQVRNVVEKQHAVWKRRFPVLSQGIGLKVEETQTITVACAVLHNLAIDQKEAEPPEDPELPPLNVGAEQEPRADIVQRTLVEHFRTLL